MANSLKGIYAIWWREGLVFIRETSRVASAIISPIIWLVIFGGALSNSLSIAGMNYEQFIFGGILVQTFLFSSLFYGAYLVWDRKIDVLKSVLVSPLSRVSVFLGKELGGVTIALVESAIVLVIGPFIGVQYTATSIAEVLVIVAIASAGLSALGLAIGSFMESPEGFQLLSSLVLFPLFFLSGALFPINTLTGPLKVLAEINPVTYIVDLIRNVLTGVHYIALTTDIIALLAFVVAANLVGIWAFRRMRS